MSEKTIQILMTGGGAPGAAGILKCLQQMENVRIVAADANANAVGRYFANDFRKIPLASEPGFVKELLSICVENAVDIVLPLVTKELVPLSKHVAEFEAIGTKILVSPLSSLEIVNDKSRLYQFLEWRGIPVPVFRVVDTVSAFESAAKELGYPEKDICFKPSVSNGSRGFRIISHKLNDLDLLFNHKPSSTYLSLDNAITILSSGNFPELLVSEYLPGDEYSVDCLVDDGDVVLIVPRVRKRMVNGISVEGEFIRDEQVIGYCTQVLKELRLHGNIGIQVKKSASGKFLLLEINPRVQGSISSALGAGINLPVLAVKQELGLPISAAEREIKWGTKFSRYWSEVFY